MKLLFVSGILFLSTSLWANDVINLKADMVLFKCQDIGKCMVPVSEGQNLQIILENAENSKIFRGEHQFEKIIDNLKFTGTIRVSKFQINSHFKYFIQAFLFSTKSNKSTLESLGNAFVDDDIKKLNNISWKKEFDEKESSYVASIVIGSDKNLNIQDSL